MRRNGVQVLPEHAEARRSPLHVPSALRRSPHQASVERHLDRSSAELGPGGSEPRDGDGSKRSEGRVALRELVRNAKHVGVRIDGDDSLTLQVAEVRARRRPRRACRSRQHAHDAALQSKSWKIQRAEVKREQI